MSFEEEHGFGDKKTSKDRLKGKKKSLARKMVSKVGKIFKKTESSGQKSQGGNLKSNY